MRRYAAHYDVTVMVTVVDAPSNPHVSRENSIHPDAALRNSETYLKLKSRKTCLPIIYCSVVRIVSHFVQMTAMSLCPVQDW